MHECVAKTSAASDMCRERPRTFGLVVISSVSSSACMCCGVVVETRYCSQVCAPLNIRPPPTTTMQLSILLFMFSFSVRQQRERHPACPALPVRSGTQPRQSGVALLQ